MGISVYLFQIMIGGFTGSFERVAGIDPIIGISATGHLVWVNSMAVREMLS